MDQEIWKLILSHLSGENNEDEETRLKKWLSQDPVHRQQYEQACRLWQETAEPPSDNNWQDSFSVIRSSVLQGEVVEKLQSAPKPASFHLRPWISIAAVLTGLTLMVFLFQSRKPVVQNHPVVWITEKAPAGQVMDVLLPDSTRIWLNAGSSIRFPKNLNVAGTRNVELKGEAFFKVKRDVHHPFIVKSLNLQTRVLGTSFNIKAWTKESQQVTVMTGKVAVSRDSAGIQSAAIHLLPNQKVSYEIHTGKLVRENIEDATDHNAWINGKMIFEQTPVQQVFETIERRYQVKIKTDHDFKGCKLTASFKNISLTEVLQTLKVTLEMNYTINQQTIYIKGGKCN